MCVCVCVCARVRTHTHLYIYIRSKETNVKLIFQLIDDGVFTTEDENEQRLV